ncbi:MAG: hypothetical protein AAGE61_11610 [Pseudomonadota bacterium]
MAHKPGQKKAEKGRLRKQIDAWLGIGLVIGLSVALSACSSSELSEDASDVFVEVEEDGLASEIGASADQFTASQQTRKVRLSVEEAQRLEREGNAPRVAAARRARADYCPSIQILSGTGVLTAFAAEDEDASRQVDHQAAITRSGRECRLEDGNLIMRIGAAGRAVRGPNSEQTSINLPIRVAIIEDDQKVLFSQLYAQPITFQSANAEGFSFVEENVTVPFPQTENLKILVGFDTKDGPLAQRLNPTDGAQRVPNEG